MFCITETVTPSRTGVNGKLKLVGALNMMQDCSEMWVESEPQYKDYFIANHISQLLASRQVDVLRVPSIGEKLTITTSIFGCKGLQGYRNTTMRDEWGIPCYVTWSMGVFVSYDTGRMVKLPSFVTESIQYDPQYEMEYLERKIVVPNIEFLEYNPIKVCRDDIDYNQHMNNTQYVRIASCELLPEDFIIKRLRIEYKIAAKYKEVLHPRKIITPDGKIIILLVNEKNQNYVIMEFSDKI
ncbi:MAG: thioesterase [Bacteroides sp.]|nr:thioesterase [Bacteroides sp.]